LEVFVSDPLARQSLNLQLWFGDVLVADLLDVFPHQGTWFAGYRQIVAPGQGPLQERLCELIRACEAWNERLERGENPDPYEFDRFADVLESGAWRVPCPDGTELRMTYGPAFFGGETSWNHTESAPSRALAAGRAWARLTGSRRPP
jgi:hypothetical protein